MEALYATIDVRLAAGVLPMMRDAPLDGDSLDERATALGLE